MVKLTQEHSKALGFPKLGHFTSFITEYTVAGAKIQKIVDDDFNATCYKIYPIIVGEGVDPKSFEPKNDKQTLLNKLREEFPVSKQVGYEEKDESTGSCSEEDESECVVVATSVIGPKKLSPVVAQKIEAGLKCTKCLTLTSELASVRKNMGETIKNLELENQKLRSQILTLKDAGLGVADKLIKVRKELEAEKGISHNRLLKWNKLVTDPEYIAWQDYCNFDSFKRKRIQ
jgi:hypothetical protein